MNRVQNEAEAIYILHVSMDSFTCVPCVSVSVSRVFTLSAYRNDTGISQQLRPYNSSHSSRALPVCPVSSQGSNPHVHQNHGRPSFDHHSSSPDRLLHFPVQIPGGQESICRPTSVDVNVRSRSQSGPDLSYLSGRFKHHFDVRDEPSRLHCRRRMHSDHSGETEDSVGVAPDIKQFLDFKSPEPRGRPDKNAGDRVCGLRHLFRARLCHGGGSCGRARVQRCWKVWQHLLSIT